MLTQQATESALQTNETEGSFYVGLEYLALGCELVKRLHQEPTDPNKQAVDRWLQGAIGNISSMDIESFDGIELCELALLLEQENPNTIGLQNLIFSNSPSAIVALGDIVRNTQSAQAVELLFTVAKNEIQIDAPVNACRVIATLLYSSKIEKQNIPSEIIPVINGLENGINLLHRVSNVNSPVSIGSVVDKVKNWTASNTSKQFIEFRARPGKSRDTGMLEELANQVIDEATSFEETLKVIYLKLTDQKASTEDRIDSYNKLLVIQSQILDRLNKQNIADILPIIFSTPGLMQDLYAELGRIEVFSGSDFGLWIRAGLKSPWYRDQCLEALVHAGVFGVETSDLRVQMFEALKNSEITPQEVLSIANQKYGKEAADRLWTNIEEMESHLGASGATPLDFTLRQRKPIEWIIKPSIDRIFDNAVKGIKESLGYKDTWQELDAHADKFRERILGNIATMTYEDLSSWTTSLGWDAKSLGLDMKQDVGQYEKIFQCMQALYIQHALIRYCLPIARQSVSNSATRAKMADVFVARKFRESDPVKNSELDPRVLSLFHSISTGGLTPFDEIVLNIGLGGDSPQHNGAKRSNQNILLEQLHSSIKDKSAEQFFLPFLPFSTINTKDLVVKLTEDNQMQVFASGREVSKVKLIPLDDKDGFSFSNGQRRARYSYDQGALVDVDSGEILLDNKTFKGNFHRCIPDSNFCYHSAPQDHHYLGLYHQADTIGESFALFFGGNNWYNDLMSVLELGSQISQTALYKTTKTVEKVFREEQRSDLNFRFKFSVTHLFDLENGDRYAICHHNGKNYLMPLKLQNLECN